jgi:hypothetical protein
MPDPKVSVLFLGCSLALLLSLFPANAISQTYTFTTVDVPGAISTACTDI